MNPIRLSQLEPGLYQIATPDQIEIREETVELIEDVHFWKDRDEKNPRAHLNLSTLVWLFHKIGGHVDSQEIEKDRDHIAFAAKGSILWPDGTLEVYPSTKEFNVNERLFHAALQKVGSENWQTKPNEQITTAMAKVPLMETALDLVSQLPPLVQAEIMRKQLEVQMQREGLTRSKAEGRVMRYFLRKAGIQLSLRAGFGRTKITVQHAILKRVVGPEELAKATKDLYGGGAASPAQAAPASEDEPETENGEDARAEQAAEEEEMGAEAAAEETATPDERPAERPAGEAADSRQQPQQPELPEQAPGAAASVVCDYENCSEILADNVVAYCQSAKGRAQFKGKNYCFNHQDVIRGRTKAGGP